MNLFKDLGVEAEFKDNSNSKTTVLTSGNVVVIEPGTVHTFRMIEDSSWINLLTVKNNPDNPDICK